MGFKRNACNTCLYNKRTRDGAVMIRRHVDDLKALSKSRRQLDKIIQDLKEIYGEIMVHTGYTHDNLGMILKYDHSKRHVQINMEKYISGYLEDSQEDAP
jgi:hypothetical protein